MTDKKTPPFEDPEYWLEAGRLAELGLFAGTLVHELKQPLFAIKAMIQLILSHEQPAALRERLEQMLGQAEQMEHILEGYRSMVQRPGEWKQPFHINDQVRAACDTLRYRARQMGVEVFMSLSAGLPLIQGNPVAAQQAVVNILQNALDASNGGVHPRVEVLTRQLDGNLEVCIKDNGTGIAEGDLVKVFDPFFTTKPPGQGTGLGLTITRELVCRFGGSAELENHVDGLSVRIIFPIEG